MAFLCVSTFYPLLYILSGGLAMWIFIRQKTNVISLFAAWTPLLLFLLLALLSGTLGALTGLSGA